MRHLLTNPQNSIWLTEKFYAGTSVNNICGYVYISEAVDFKALRKSINELVKTNDSMRLIFKEENSSCVQYLSEYKEFDIDIVELTSEKEIENKAQEMANIPFEITDNLLFKFILFKLPNGSGGFIVTVHHIISDSWTLGLIAKEVTGNYSEILNSTYEGKTFPSYLNYIEYEKEYINSDKFNKDREYWNNVFETIPELASIPSTKDTVSKTSSCKGNREKFIIPKKQINSIKEFCTKNKLSVYNFFMAAYSLYLGKVSNLDDFVIGTPILNRTNFEQKHTMGMFISTVPLRINLDHNISYVDFSKKIAADTMSFLRHQRYPYQAMLENLRKKDSNIPNLYNVVLSYQITKTVEENSNIKYSTDWVFNGNSADDLQIHLFDLHDEESMTVAYDYKADKYDSQDIKDIHDRILTIIDQVISNNEILLKDIEIVTPEEKYKILYEFNNTKVDYPQDKTIVDLFEDQVEKTPDNIAVVFEDQKLTYRELNEKANQLAYHLISNNVQAGDIIGIFLNKSLEVIVSMFAILKSGAAFLPLDIDYPEERLKYILNNSKPKVVLSSKDISKQINSNTIFVDLNNSLIYGNNSIDNLKLKISPDDVMYVMYTSGSTGNPKGVMVKHKNIVRLAMYPNFINFSNQEIMVQTGTIVFDACIFEIFGSLLHGFKLYIIKKENLLDIEYFSKFLEEKHVSILFLTTGLFNQFGLQKPDMFKNLKCLLTGGDIISAQSTQKIINSCSKLKIINCYGPTENGSYSTCYEITGNEINIPIGKPITNSSAYIVSNSGALCPVGVPGELWVGGNGVAKGYLNNENLTNDKFIKNPFGDGIIYKTGDLVKWLPDGNIEFIGRIDNQVKVRGFRIELSEIDKQILDKNLDIKQSLTVIHNVNNSKIICSYIVSNNNINIKELKKSLEMSLPTYMVPTYIIQLDNFPLNINGKIDRKLLPLPNDNNDKEILLPRNEIDSIIISCLGSILNINRISISDSFFALGGDSLSAIAFSSKLSDEINCNINVQDIFNYPVIKDLSDYITTLSGKRHINTITKAEKMEYYPLSSAQKRIYYSSSLDSNSTLYNIAGGIIVDKLLDIHKLQECFNILINRHEALRSHFDVVDNEVVQTIDDNINIKLVLDSAPTNDLNKVYAQFVRPFDLSKAPLFRTKLVKLNDGKMLLLLDMHHIISDGTSLGILLEELCTLYNGSVLPEKQLDYKDFTIWEKEQFESAKFKSSKEFWLNQFKDEIPLLNMPTTNPRPSIQSFEGSNYHTKLSSEIFDKVNKVAKELNITPYMLMLSAYYILLSKYTSQDDIVVGTPIVGRELPELSNMLGMFVNTLALRNKVEHNLSFEEFCNIIKASCLNSFKNQSYPFDMLVKDLNIKRDTSRNPLFDVMFIYQNAGYPEINFNNTKAEYFIPDNNVSKFDLSLEVIPVNNEYSLRFEYCTKLFNEDFIKRLSLHYINILNTVLNNTNTKIANIDMLSEDERNQILYEFNNTKVDYPKDKTIVDLFEEQVEKTPDNIAVIFEDQKLTYRELNAKANQLARLLIANNVAINDIVGILLDKSLETIISILGILKTGAAFLPIDISYPTERVEYIIKDSKANIVITNQNFIHKINDNVQPLSVDVENNIFSQYTDTNINIKYDVNTLAYIMYTSGSTGNPKGVMVTHKNIVRLVKNNNFITFDKDEHILQTGSIVFDACTFEIWGALLNGFKLFVMKKEDLLDSYLLENYLEKSKISTLWLTAPLFNQLCETNPYMFKNVKKLLTGGDVLSPKHINIVREANPYLTIINGYGPTENTTFSCCFTIDKTYTTSIPIGKPISNSTAYVVSNLGLLCPIGVPGELWVGGDGVSKGYLNNEVLTNEKFMQNPFGEGILYKTGDLVKWLPDGNIEFIGRIDNQVKVRGFRIELSEIDNNILTYNNIKQSISVIHNINNSKFICSYIVAENSVDIKALKEYLSKRLANYMIPTYIIKLDNLPLNINGKVDRKLLPTPTTNESTDIIKTRNSIDETILSILENYISTENISIEDNLFDLGLDSLSSISLVSNINNTLSIQLNIKDIFNHPTLKDLSDYISTLSEERNINTIAKAEKKEYYPLSSAQKRMYYSSSLDHNSTLYNIAGGIILDKILDIDRLQECFNTLIERHDALRTHFDIVENEVVQIIDDNIDFKLSLDTTNTNDLNNIYSDFVKPFDLSKAPLFRTKLIKLNNNKMLLLLDMHHIISDGTSLNILLQELCDLYNGSILSEKQIDYKDFTLWEKEQFESEAFNISKEYWVNQFKDEIPLLNMPTTNPRPSVQSFEGSNYHTKLSSEMFDKVNKVAKELNITPYMLMLSAYYILLSKYTSQNDIVVGTPIVGRELPELSNMLGMFVNTLALRNNIEHNLAFEEFSRNIKENCLNSFKNQRYPFDMLVKDLNIKRDTSRSPLFDVMFVYQNSGYPEINFKDSKSEYFIPDSNISKFDLTLEVLPKNNEYDIRFEYCSKLFDEDFIERLSSHYINILNVILENTEIKIADIDMLSREERNQILYEFNNTKVDYLKDKTIVDLFEEQVEKTPDNIAVVFEDQKLSYRELNEKANQLARYLIENGVTNNSIVGIMVPRCLEMIIAMFGILKARAAYLPLDPSYPKNRIKYILKDSNVNLLLTKESYSLDNILTIDIGISTSKIYSKYQKHNLNNNFSSSNLAYVIYTSGSTGNPKGVTITHRNVNNFIKGVTSKIKFNNVIVSVTTICFDIFVLESILPLQRGLTVVLANESEQTVPQLLNELCIKNNVTMLQTTPSKFSLLISDEDSLEFLKNIKTIMLGGEPFPYNLLLKIRNLTKCKIYNMYGPTETTVWSSIKELTNSDNITIGTPIANTSMYVLDNNLKILPIGVPGTLYIGGDGISKGYFNKEDLTHEKFIINPYNNCQKIYNTGDLAKWSNNGELICLGRSDFQVKIRGLRIELEEIEKAILTFNGIEKAVVTVSIDSLNRQVLCAYLVSNARISISELKQYLGMFLPNYMLPTYIMQIDDFKYTPNGKIDKKALPSPDFTTERKRISLPKTDTEYKILKIWEDLLCISPISISDDFFEIGGDSLLALKMQIELLKQDINVTYAEIFKYNTIKKLASLVDKKSSNFDSNMDIYASYDYSNINTVLNNNNISNLVNIEYHPIGNVLLTGVTGFLGAHIIDYLMKNTDIKVYCLVRKDPSISLTDKVLNKLHFYFGNIYDELINKRIFIINSDLTQDKLGLTDEKIVSLSNKISCVINSAALVKHYGSYKDFEAINVISVKKLIDFCKKYNKKLVQISTISVSGNTLSDFAVNTQNFMSDIDFSETNLYIGQSMENVYVRSKFEAEKLILEEIEKNKLDALILRIGNITNRFSDGKFQSNPTENAFANKLKAFLELKVIPDYILDKYIEFTPVDYVAESIIKSIEYADNQLNILHIYNHNHVYICDFIKMLPSKYEINIMSDIEFKEFVKNIFKNNEKKYIMSHILNDLNSKNELIFDTHIKIKSNFSQYFLNKINFFWPIINKKYIENLLKNL